MSHGLWKESSSLFIPIFSAFFMARVFERLIRQHFTVTATTSTSNASVAVATSTGIRTPAIVASAHAGESSSTRSPSWLEQKHLKEPAVLRQLCLQAAPAHSSTSTQNPDSSFRKPDPHGTHTVEKFAGEPSRSPQTGGWPEQSSSTRSEDQHSTWIRLLLSKLMERALGMRGF